MHTATPTNAPAGFDSALHGACEQSARSVMSALWKQNPGVASDEAFAEILLSMTGAIERTAQLLIQGKQVKVIEDDEALTTQAAADLLNVSRPHLVKLLETGAIAQLPKVGRHRRVARAAVLKYKRRRDAQRAQALQELADMSQRLGLGY